MEKTRVHLKTYLAGLKLLEVLAEKSSWKHYHVRETPGKPDHDEGPLWGPVCTQRGVIIRRCLPVAVLITGWSPC
ncbi:MAG: hypothetical protein Ct9H300mP14_05070 [Gammaproteobacteria bacterium]|nr:MAG: hypothetical protein Ct9H300mP14_05070 [Gammaproteobacteria bacterium]